MTDARLPFHYRALTAAGTVVRGSIPGESVRQVANELTRQGLTPVHVGSQEEASWRTKFPAFSLGSHRNLIFFTRELSILLGSGIPLDRALCLTAEAAGTSRFRRVVTDVLALVKDGKPLADGLASHPAHFSELHVNMVRAGELSGNLGEIFERLAEFESSRNELRDYITSALLYPVLLTAVGLASIVVMLGFVVPRFASVFEGSHVALPLPMLLLLDLSNLVRSWSGVGAAGLLIAGLGSFLYFRSSPGRLVWDSLRLKIPFVGDSLRKADTARFARAMGTLVGNSVPLLQSLKAAKAVLQNRRLANSLESVTQSVKRGEGIARPLAKSGEFPPLAAHLLVMGEETGRLDSMFLRIADIFDRETRTAIRQFTSLFEPAVILVMGLAVGSVILSMLVAITSVNDVAGF